MARGGGRISHPALHKAALPWEEGGVGLVDMAIQADCLHAKVAARLLHPARHPWKLLMRQRLGAVLPALGAAVAVSSLQVTARTMPDPRLLAYLRGLQRTRLKKGGGERAVTQAWAASVTGWLAQWPLESLGEIGHPRSKVIAKGR